MVRCSSVAQLIETLRAVDREDVAPILAAVEVVKKYTYTTGDQLGVLTPYAQPDKKWPVPLAKLDEFRQLLKLLKPHMTCAEDADRLDNFLHAEVWRLFPLRRGKDFAGTDGQQFYSGVPLTTKHDPPRWSHLAVDMDRALNRLKDRLRGRAPRPDGPAPPNLLWWDGVEHELPPRAWKILNVLWSRTEPIKVDQLIAEVWGHDHEPADSTVRSALSELNAALDTVGVRKQARLRAGWVVWG
jgi:hypothetical protein